MHVSHSGEWLFLVCHNGFLSHYYILYCFCIFCSLCVCSLCDLVLSFLPLFLPFPSIISIICLSLFCCICSLSSAISSPLSFPFFTCLTDLFIFLSFPLSFFFLLLFPLSSPPPPRLSLAAVRPTSCVSQSPWWCAPLTLPPHTVLPPSCVNMPVIWAAPPCAESWLGGSKETEPIWACTGRDHWVHMHTHTHLHSDSCMHHWATVKHLTGSV